jgi:HNH endonuclease
VLALLEAAHIIPEAGGQTNFVNNGLLLRADIHTLFDLYLLAIHPDTRRVVLAGALMISAYAGLNHKRLRQPRDDALGPANTGVSNRDPLCWARMSKSAPLV